MLIDILFNDNTINFSPKTELEEIIQNVKTIASTVKGTVPLDREFGLNTESLDLPVNVARAKLSAHIIEAIRRFEPRADVVRVTFREGGMQQVLPVVTLKIPDTERVNDNN